MFPRPAPQKLERSAGEMVKWAVNLSAPAVPEERAPLPVRRTRAGRRPTPRKKGGFHERPEGRMERPRDDGPRFFQLPCGLEAETDDGNPRRGQCLEGIFYRDPSPPGGSGACTPLDERPGRGRCPGGRAWDGSGPYPDGARWSSGWFSAKAVGAVPGQTGHQMDSRFETLFPVSRASARTVSVSV